MKYFLLGLLLLTSLSAQARYNPTTKEQAWLGFNIKVESQYKWYAAFYEQISIKHPQPSIVQVWVQRLNTELPYRATLSKVTLLCNENKIATTNVIYYADLLKQKQVKKETLAPVFKPIEPNSEEDLLQEIVCKKQLTH